MKFSWKSLVGLVLIVGGAVMGIITKTPIVVTTAIISVVCGATLAIAEEVKKTTLKGWQLYTYLATTIGGTIVLSLSGYSESTIGEIVGAVILIASVIFGVVTNKITSDKAE